MIKKFEWGFFEVTVYSCSKRYSDEEKLFEYFPWLGYGENYPWISIPQGNSGLDIFITTTLPEPHPACKIVENTYGEREMVVKMSADLSMEMETPTICIGVSFDSLITEFLECRRDDPGNEHRQEALDDVKRVIHELELAIQRLRDFVVQ